jgi:hypothetical protein
MQNKKPEVVKPEPINNTKLVEEFRARGGRIAHVHQPNNHDGTRAMTIAFIDHSGRVEVATSVTHRNDTFTKKVGTKLAIEHFLAGKTVSIPLQNRRRVTDFLLNMFFPITWAR